MSQKRHSEPIPWSTYVQNDSFYNDELEPDLESEASLPHETSQPDAQSDDLDQVQPLAYLQYSVSTQATDQADRPTSQTTAAFRESEIGMRVISLWPDSELLVGRISEENKDTSSIIPVTTKYYFTISDVNVSGNHFRVYSTMYDGDHPDERAPLFYCEDLKSTNGTWVSHEDGREELIGMKHSTPNVYLLSHGQTIFIKPYWKFKFVQTGSNESAMWAELQRKEIKLFSETFPILDRVLGSGASGKVYLATHHRQQLACKVVRFEALWNSVKYIGKSIEGEQQETSFRKYHRRKDIVLEFKCAKARTFREIKVWTTLKHPNIATLVKVFQSPHNVYIFTELAYGGDLFSYQQAQGGVLTHIDALVISRQVAKGIEYLHSEGVAHRDVKPENILLTRYDIGHRVVLTDFGHATVFATPQHNIRMKSQVGTKGFAAPELLGKQGYTKAVDLWSLGMTIACLLTGELLSTHEERQTDTQEALSMGPPKEFVYDRPNVKHLVDGLLHLDASQRPSATEVLQHSWFCGSSLIRDGLEDCEASSLTAWATTSDLRHHEPITEVLPDLMPSESQRQKREMVKYLRRTPDTVVSPHFTLGRHLVPHTNSRKGESQKLLDQLKLSGKLFLQGSEVAETSKIAVRNEYVQAGESRELIDQGYAGRTGSRIGRIEDGEDPSAPEDYEGIREEDNEEKLSDLDE